jgi:N-acetyl-beta-hexosaminidase
VILCRLYKLNYVHIHLTDDGAFSFPSTAYPELAAHSPWCGGCVLFYSSIQSSVPSLSWQSNSFEFESEEEEDKGVGGVALRRRYNLTELHELQAFASARGVAIIGEKIQKRHFLSTFNVYKI